MIDSLSLNTTGKTSAILSFPFPRHLHILLQISPGCECARFPCSAPLEVRWQSSCTEAPHWFNSWVPEKLHIPWRKRIFSTHCLKLHNPALSPGTATADLSRALAALPWLHCPGCSAWSGPSMLQRGTFLLSPWIPLLRRASGFL